MTRALGRRVEHDPRSRNFPFRPAATPPKTVLWDHHGPVLDQGELGSCTGNALAQWCNTAFVQQCRRGPDHWLDETDAVDLYSRATHLDGFPGVYPPTDTGSSGLAVCKAGVRRGLLAGYLHAFGFEALLMTLQHTAVIVGTGWYESMFEPQKNGFLNVTGDPVEGHEYLVLGCAVELGYITLLNSWGAGWGENGRARISFPQFAHLLDEQGDVTVPIL